MGLLFSSHLLPDVEAVCDYIIVLGAGKLLTQGNIQQLKQVHNRCFELRLKADEEPFAQQLSALGCSIQRHDSMLIVQLPEGKSPRMLWQLAAEKNLQIRHLKPQRSTLEEVFLGAMERM